MALKKCEMGSLFSLSPTSFLATLFVAPYHFSIFCNFLLMSSNITQLSDLREKGESERAKVRARERMSVCLCSGQGERLYPSKTF